MAPSPTPLPESSTSEPYPPLLTAPASNVAYPGLKTPIPNAVRFELDRPIKAGATLVTGSAPAGVVINIVNVTLMGEWLGNGVVGDDNRFSINVTPLLAKIRIGLEIADIGSSGYAVEDFFNDAFLGPESRNFPQVGYYLDTALVEP